MDWIRLDKNKDTILNLREL